MNTNDKLEMPIEKHKVLLFSVALSFLYIVWDFVTGVNWYGISAVVPGLIKGSVWDVIFTILVCNALIAAFYLLGRAGDYVRSEYHCPLISPLFLLLNFTLLFGYMKVFNAEINFMLIVAIVYNGYCLVERMFYAKDFWDDKGLAA